MSSTRSAAAVAPTPTSFTIERIKDAFCARFTGHVRVGAGLLCLIATVVAACCGIVWGAYWLTVLAGFAAIASGYAIYQGYQFAQLQTFEMSNLQLEEHLITLDYENERLGGEVNRLEENNSHLSQTANTFQQQLATSEQNNREQAIQISQLRTEIHQLTEVRNTFFQQASTHVTNLQQLGSSFEQIRDSAASNNVVFGERVKTLTQQVELLSTSRIELSETSSEFERKMVEQTEALAKAGQILKEAFTAIQEWKDEEGVNKRIQQLERLGRQLKETNQELRETSQFVLEASKNLSETQGQLKQFKENLESFERLKQGFEVALQSLLEKIEQLGVENTNLTTVKREICEAAQIFQQFQVRTTN